MLSGALHTVGFRPHEVPANLLRLRVGIGHDCLEEVAEVLWPRRVPGLTRGVDIDLLQPHRNVQDRPQVHVWVAVLGGPHHALRAPRAGEPNVRVGLLHGQHPGVDRPVLVIFPLITERPRRGPALDDEIVRLLKPPPVLRGVNAGLQGLDGPPAYEAGDDPAPGIAVQHGDFFGHPDGVIDGDDVAQDGDLDALGELGDDRGIQVHTGFHAPVGGVMFVRHDAVEAHCIGEGILLMVLVVEDMGLLGIEMGVGKTETARIVLVEVLIGHIPIGLLRKPKDLDLLCGSP